MPTAWIAGIITGVFLIVTAGVGGLDPVKAAPPEVLEPGDTHENDQLSLTVERAVLIDNFREAGAIAAEGERVLAFMVSAENVWTEPLMTSGNNSVGMTLRVDALGDVPPDSVARMDDATWSPYLQPGVPAELVVAWLVPEELFHESEAIDLTIRNPELYYGQHLTYGASWVDPVTVATMQVVPTDVGAGLGAEDGEA